MERIYTIRLENGSFYQARAAIELGLSVHDQCVVHRNFYYDIGSVARVGAALEQNKGMEMPVIQRKADVGDVNNAAANRGRCRDAMRTAQELVGRLGLPMKLLNALYSLDGRLLTIQFNADGRVDFRELVKELSHALNTRIELRQIGVRDECSIHGGISVCGQVLCCCRFLKEFNSINVRMAKDQDLSLTPATISGICGRLKCCLRFEHEGYLELGRNMPRKGDRCECPSGRGRVCDRNLLTQEVTVCLEDGSQVRCGREDVHVLPPDRSRQRQHKGGDRKTTDGGAQDTKEPRNAEKADSRRSGQPAGQTRSAAGADGRQRRGETAADDGGQPSE